MKIRKIQDSIQRFQCAIITDRQTRNLAITSRLHWASHRRHGSNTFSA